MGRGLAGTSSLGMLATTVAALRCSGRRGAAPAWVRQWAAAEMRKPLELPDTPHGSRYPRRSRLSVGVDIGEGFHPYPNHAGDMVPKIPTGSWMQGRLGGEGYFVTGQRGRMSAVGGDD